MKTKEIFIYAILILFSSISFAQNWDNYKGRLHSDGKFHNQDGRIHEKSKVQNSKSKVQIKSKVQKIQTKIVYRDRRDRISKEKINSLVEVEIKKRIDSKELYTKNDYNKLLGDFNSYKSKYPEENKFYFHDSWKTIWARSKYLFGILMILILIRLGGQYKWYEQFKILKPRKKMAIVLMILTLLLLILLLIYFTIIAFFPVR